MGKGARNRNRQDERREECARLRAEARRIHRRVYYFCIPAMLIMIVPLCIQCLTLHSLSTSAQTEEVAAKMPMMLLLGGGGIGLIAIGVTLASVLLFRSRWKWSSAGITAMVIGAVCFAAFIGMMAECFPARTEIIGMFTREVGLTFNKILERHIPMFLPIPFMFAAQYYEARVAKKREMADLIDPDLKTSSTIHLEGSDEDA